MTKGLEETFGIKSLEEIMAETENEQEEALPVPVESEALMTIPQMKGTDHADSMDKIYDESIDVARKMADLGMNIDIARAPRVLEVANQWMKTAADAKVSKRDAELKLMKLLQDQRKLDLEERKLNGELGHKDSIEGEVVFEGDRNKLLKFLRDQRKSQEDQSPE